MSTWTSTPPQVCLRVGDVQCLMMDLKASFISRVRHGMNTQTHG